MITQFSETAVAFVPTQIGILDILGLINRFLMTYSALIGLLLILLTLGLLFVELQRNRRERSEGRRQQYTLDIQRRRLSERNLDIKASARLLHRHEPVKSDPDAASTPTANVPSTSTPGATTPEAPGSTPDTGVALKLATREASMAASDALSTLAAAAAPASGPHASSSSPGSSSSKGKGKPKVGPAEKPFVVARVDLKNIGDGPVDLLACMVAGRELSDENVPGLATQARDVAWDDLEHFFWNEYEPPFTGEPLPLFRGISTTKNITYSPDQLVRLDPEQHEELIRIDAVTNFDKLYERGHVNIEYKIFTVALGYPLADLTGEQDVSPDKFNDKNYLSKLYALDLARPNYRRWRHVERTLDIVNRFTFRLALRGLEKSIWEKYWVHDPLGRLSDALGWRCFLLHHWDFDDRGDAVPAGAPDPYREQLDKMTSIEEVKRHIKDDLKIYDPEQQQMQDYPDRLADACAYARRELAPLIDAWIALNETIERCNEIDNGFAKLITTDKSPEYAHRRWEALRNEGYLLTNVRDKYLFPKDELALERYAMRTKYVLVTVKAPGHSQGRARREG